MYGGTAESYIRNDHASQAVRKRHHHCDILTHLRGGVEGGKGYNASAVHNATIAWHVRQCEVCCAKPQAPTHGSMSAALKQEQKKKHESSSINRPLFVFPLPAYSGDNPTPHPVAMGRTRHARAFPSPASLKASLASAFASLASKLEPAAFG